MREPKDSTLNQTCSSIKDICFLQKKYGIKFFIKRITHPQITLPVGGMALPPAVFIYSLFEKNFTKFIDFTN